MRSPSCGTATICTPPSWRQTGSRISSGSRGSRLLLDARPTGAPRRWRAHSRRAARAPPAPSISMPQVVDPEPRRRRPGRARRCGPRPRRGRGSCAAAVRCRTGRSRGRTGISRRARQIGPHEARDRGRPGPGRKVIVYSPPVCSPTPRNDTGRGSSSAKVSACVSMKAVFRSVLFRLALAARRASSSRTRRSRSPQLAAPPRAVRAAPRSRGGLASAAAPDIPTSSPRPESTS